VPQSTSLSSSFDIEVAANGAKWMLAPFELLNGSINDFARAAESNSDAWPDATSRVRMRVPMHLGRGVADYFHLSSKLHLILLDLDLDKDLTIVVPGDRMIKVRVLLAGRLRAIQNAIALDGAGSFLEAYPGKVSSSYLIESGQPTKMVVLNCTPEYFTEEMRLNWRLLPDPLRAVFENDAGAPHAAQTPLGPDLLRAADDIMRFSGDFPAHLQHAYLSAKCNEIASYVVRQLGQPIVALNAGLKLTVRDINRVHEAHVILAEQFRRPPPIPKLARLVGLNQTKLKAAFKSVFAMTINEFTIKRRMDRGAELLATTNLSIAEIAHAVGYDHPANFTHAFRRHFNHSPRQLRRAAKIT